MPRINDYWLEQLKKQYSYCDNVVISKTTSKSPYIYDFVSINCALNGEISEEKCKNCEYNKGSKENETV